MENKCTITYWSDDLCLEHIGIYAQTGFYLIFLLFSLFSFYYRHSLSSIYIWILLYLFIKNNYVIATLVFCFLFKFYFFCDTWIYWCIFRWRRNRFFFLFYLTTLLNPNFVIFSRRVKMHGIKTNDNYCSSCAGFVNEIIFSTGVQMWYTSKSCEWFGKEKNLKGKIHFRAVAVVFDRLCLHATCRDKLTNVSVCVLRMKWETISDSLAPNCFSPPRDENLFWKFLNEWMNFWCVHFSDVGIRYKNSSLSRCVTFSCMSGMLNLCNKLILRTAVWRIDGEGCIAIGRCHDGKSLHPGECARVRFALAHAFIKLWAIVLYSQDTV